MKRVLSWVVSISLILVISACSTIITPKNNDANPTASDVSVTIKPEEISPSAASTSSNYTETTAANDASTTTGQLTVHYLDVGQADSVFIELPNGETMLIDAGNPENGEFIVDYVKNKGYDTINYLIATHPHADHIGGMAYVIDHLKISSIYMPKVQNDTKTFEGLLTAISNNGLKVNTAKAGVNIVAAGNLKIDIIAPNSSSYDELNDYSAVIKLTFENTSFLFMGDAEQLSENEITSDVSADVLKVGHHGSSSSAGETFLNNVAPKYAVISLGTDNDYDHPAQATLEKLSAANVTTYRTDKDGTVVFTSDGTNISVDKTSSATVAVPPATTTSSVSISNVDKAEELVTITNTGEAAINLTGWVLISVKGDQKFTFPTYSLEANSSITVASGDAVGTLHWTNNNVWSNSSSDPAELYDAAGALIDTY